MESKSSKANIFRNNLEIIFLNSIHAMENDLNKFLLKLWGQWSFEFFKQQLVTWAELETLGCLFGI
jgi:hypothetical protein